MNIRYAIVLIVTAATLTGWAADPLTELLQKGLFEEEANHDLNAAIQSYQFVVTRADQQRKLAATAMFRLGECYRKLGRTNESAIQYQRVVRDFADQTNLVTLSLQNLGGVTLQVTGRETGPDAHTLLLERELRGQETELVRLQTLIMQLTNQSRVELKRVILTITPDAQLEALLQARLRQEQQIALLKPEFTENHPEMIAALAVVEQIDRQVDDRLDGILAGLKLKMEAQKAGVDTLHRELDRGRAGGPSSTVAVSANNARTVVMSNLRRTLGETEAILQKLRDLQKRGQPPQLADSSELRSRIVAAFGVEETDRWVRAWQSAGSEYSSAEGNLSSAEEDKKSEAESRKSSAESGLKNTFDALIAGVEEQQGKLKVKLQFLTAQAEGSSAENASLKAADDDPVRFEQALEIERLKAMLRNSPDLINAVNPQVGKTPLCSAAAKGQVDVVGFLLDNRADVNQGQAAGNKTALHEAVENGHKAVVDLLLARGADVNATTTQGVTPLHRAVGKGFYQVCETLLTHQAKLDPICSSAYYNWGSSTVSGKWTPLLIAIYERHPMIAELLLQKGASVDLSWSEGPQPREGTPLVLAASLGDRPLVELLLKYHAKVDQMASGKTALMVACQTGHFDLIDPLMAAGASVNPPVAAYSPTPLFQTIMQGDTNAIKKLLAAGANPNVLLGDGRTLLMVVMDRYNPNVINNFQEILNLLLSAKPDLEQTSPDGATVLHRWCTQERSPSAGIAALIDAGANPNAVWTKSRQETPLFGAVRSLRKDVVSLLLDHGAQVNWINEQGLTPIALVKQSAAESQRSPAPSATALSYQARLTRALRSDQEPVPARATPQEIIDLLIKAGADETYHLKDSISISRSSWPSPIPVLRRTDKYPNRFTLLEFLAMAYYQDPHSLSFPSLESISIRHRGTADKPGRIQTVNAEEMILSGDRSKDDVFLEWGDIVEVPEAIHLRDEQWGRFPPAFGDKWGQNLQRTVTIDINGTSQKLALQMPKLWGPQSEMPFWLSWVVQRSGLVRSTSDLSRVRVIRRDPASGKETVISADFSNSAAVRVPPGQPGALVPGQAANPSPNDDLWLQDGDRIEIPDRAEPDAKPGSPPGGA